MAEEEKTGKGTEKTKAEREDKTEEAEFDPTDFVPSFISIWKGVVTKPVEFFERMPQRGGFVNPTIFMLICMFVSGIMTALVTRGMFGFFRGFLLAAVMAFVLAALLYLFATKLFEGKGDYEGTFRVVAYTSAMSVLSWIPVIGILASLYQLYLAAVGLQKIHGLDMGKTAVVIILTVVVFVALSLLFGPLFLLSR